MEIIRCKEMVIRGGDGLCQIWMEPINLGKEIHLKLIPESLKNFCATWVKERKIKLV